MASIIDHPIDLLRRLRFRVTVNTDNRLMSDITMTKEMHNLVQAFGFGWDEIEWLTINAMKSAFWPFDQRLRIIEGQIKPGYAIGTSTADSPEMPMCDVAGRTTKRAAGTF